MKKSIKVKGIKNLESVDLKAVKGGAEACSVRGEEIDVSCGTSFTIWLGNTYNYELHLILD